MGFEYEIQMGFKLWKFEYRNLKRSLNIWISIEFKYRNWNIEVQMEFETFRISNRNLNGVWIFKFKYEFQI